MPVIVSDEALALAQAARMAGVGRLDFQAWLAGRKIPIHYDVHDLEEDVCTLHRLGRI